MPFLMILIVGMKNEEIIYNLKKLGAQVKDVRVMRSLTQQELADKCGLNRNYIGMLERGERNPSYATLLKIAHGLGTSLSNLINF